MNIPGHKVMLLGPSGSGKTYSLYTLIQAGIKPCIIWTEPGAAALRKALNDHNLPEDSYASMTITPVAESWNSLIEMSKNINSLSFEGITKVSDPNRSQYQQFIQFLTACNNFVDERTGEVYGDVSTWNTDRALVTDTLSGLNEMAMNLVVGIRPTRSMPDWMVAQNNLYAAIKKLVSLRCHFILMAHVEREKDETSGEIKLMASTLGKSLAPKLPKEFDEVVFAVRRELEWYWTTTLFNVDTKARLLPYSDTIPPSWGNLMELWKQAGGVIEPSDPPLQPAAAA